MYGVVGDFLGGSGLMLKEKKKMVLVYLYMSLLWMVGNEGYVGL